MALDPSSANSALTMAGLPISSAVAFAYLLLKPRRGRSRLRTALRVLLPKHIWLHPSTLVDYQYVVAGAFAFSILFGYTVLTAFAVSSIACEGLTYLFGPPAEPMPLPLYAQALAVFGLYMALEFAYWFDH